MLDMLENIFGHEREEGESKRRGREKEEREKERAKGQYPRNFRLTEQCSQDW